MKLFLLMLLIGLVLSAPVQAKKRCQPLLEKVQLIQAKQRAGYSARRGSSLRQQEDKARAKWWQCENSTLYQDRSKKKPSANQKVAVKKTDTPLSKATKKSPFGEITHIEMNRAYQGERQQAWLVFYRPLAECRQKNNRSAFIACAEHRRRQKELFEQQIMLSSN